MSAVDALDPALCTGDLTINAVPMNTAAWTMLDLTPFWLPPTRRGADVLIPGQDGLRSFVRRPTATILSLPMVIVGTCDQDGTAYDDPWAGLETNLMYLRANVLDMMSVRPAVLTMPSGALWEGDVQIEDFQLGEHSAKAQYNAVLGLSIAAGGLTPVAS